MQQKETWKTAVAGCVRSS